MDSQSCSEIVSQLIAKSLLDIVPILGSSEFTTFENLLTKAQEYLNFSGGRVTSQELQAFLKTDQHIVDKIIQKIVSKSNGSNATLFVGGELITQDYLGSLVIEINQLIQRHHRMTCISVGNSQLPPFRIGVLVNKFHLPLDIMTTLVKTHFPNENFLLGATSAPITSNENNKKSGGGNKKKITKGKSSVVDNSAPLIEDSIGSTDSCADNTTSSFQRDTAMASIYGFCLGAVLPVPLSTIFSTVSSGLDDETEVLRILLEMTDPSNNCTRETTDHILRLPGTCNNKEYIPHIFANQQRVQVDECFRTNNMISLAYLQALHVQSRHLQYVTSSFDSAIALDSCIVSKTMKDVFLSAIEDVTGGFPFATVGASAGSVIPPWLNLSSALPSELTETDVEALLKACDFNLNSKSCAVTLMPIHSICPERFLVNSLFLAALKDVVSADAASAATSEQMAISSVQEVKTVPIANPVKTAGLAAISTSGSSKKGCVQSVAKTNKSGADEDEDEEGTSRGKKGVKSKKGGKSVGKAVASEEDFVETSLKSTKKGGKRGKDSGSSTDNSIGPSTTDNTTSAISSLVASFVAKKRVIKLFLEFCSKARVLEVEEALAYLVKCSHDDDDSSAIIDGDGDAGSVLPFFGAIHEHLMHSTLKAYTAAAERAIAGATQGTHDTRMKREQNRDQKFEELWTTLQVSSKVLHSFEKDCTEESPLHCQLFRIHSIILTTRCVPIVSLLTEFCCWENDIVCPQVPEGRVALSFEQRRQLQKDLPQDTGNLLTKLWKTIGMGDNGSSDTSATIWNFIDIISSPVFKDTFNLIVHKIDKKKEKSTSFTFKQELMDAVKAERDAVKLCPLVLSMATYQVTNSVLELPSDLLTQSSGDRDSSEPDGLDHPLVSFLLAWLSPPRYPAEDLEAIRCLLVSAADPSKSTDDHSILEAAKQAVLKKLTA